MDVLPWLLLAAFLIFAIAALFRGAQRETLQRLRAEWGKPRSRSHKMEAIVASHKARTTELAGTFALDDRTWKDLNLEEVFLAIDRTESTLGQHALYHRLRTTPAAPDLDAFESLVSRMTDDPGSRARAQMALARLQDPHGYDLWWLARRDAVETPDWFIIFPVLVAAMLVLLALLPLRPQLLPFVGMLAAVNLMLHFATFQSIAAIGTAFRQVAPLIATAQALQFLRGDDIEPIVAPLRDEAKRFARLKTISRWVSGDPLMLSVSPNPLAVTLAELIGIVYEYLNFVLPVDAAGVYLGAAVLKRHGPALVRVVAAVGDVDAAISVAALRAGEPDWTRPRFLAPGTAAKIADARHPLVADAVPNSIVLPSARGVLVTGSNMSGKSTFLRTIGVAAVLAQTIHTVPATEYAAPVFHVRSCIGRADDLLRGKSYYIVEVEALLELINASVGAPPFLFLLDELFRGTNAVERVAAGKAVLMELIGAADRPKPHVVLAATHDNELVDLLAESYTACHFGDALNDSGLVFDHRLKQGRATSRNAIALLRLHGAPSGLIERALSCAEALDRQRSKTGAKN